uniref:Protein kinase domain-containing protein n=1 Tax=Chromera velia CCMP2878 TaxID=1169474 RepID=A0A0G4G7V6_9ALVE|eukprot:Cvel_20646.t1-p1 / transcript=Cvel_20646.t1 / gene=Cvel_20646 / organism=Chromera_velia_CCMP2878 / gene_product=hypothetical protein / transcript_product=hypothetical protein / location=Cvel_scaffold1873:16293-17000(-) / protein_length=236 / sequence_SO=supercontig / SO=protein_coding / is_pseudo=false
MGGKPVKPATCSALGVSFETDEEGAVILVGQLSVLFDGDLLDRRLFDTACPSTHSPSGILPLMQKEDGAGIINQAPRCGALLNMYLETIQGISLLLSTLHEEFNVVHRDIKDTNILVKWRSTPYGPGKIFKKALGDFGLAGRYVKVMRKKKKGGKRRTSVVTYGVALDQPFGTPGYYDQEDVQKYVQSAHPPISPDVRALGVTLSSILYFCVEQMGGESGDQSRELSERLRQSLVG